MTYRTSPKQYETLLQFMAIHGDLGQRGSCMQDRATSNESWEQLKNLLNSDDSGSPRDVRRWQRVWADWKYHTKQKASEARRHKKLTGLEKRLLNLIGPELLENSGQDAGRLKTERPEEVYVGFKNEEDNTSCGSRDISPPPLDPVSPPPSSPSPAASPRRTRSDTANGIRKKLRKRRCSSVQNTSEPDLIQLQREYQSLRRTVEAQTSSLESRVLEIESTSAEARRMDAEARLLEAETSRKTVELWHETQQVLMPFLTTATRALELFCERLTGNK